MYSHFISPVTVMKSVGLKPRFDDFEYLILVERNHPKQNFKENKRAIKRNTSNVNKLVRIFINNLPQKSVFEMVEYSKNYVRKFGKSVLVNPKNKKLAKLWLLAPKKQLKLSKTAKYSSSIGFRKVLKNIEIGPKTRVIIFASDGETYNDKDASTIEQLVSEKSKNKSKFYSVCVNSPNQKLFYNLGKISKGYSYLQPSLTNTRFSSDRSMIKQAVKTIVGLTSLHIINLTVRKVTDLPDQSGSLEFDHKFTQPDENLLETSFLTAGEFLRMEL